MGNKSSCGKLIVEFPSVLREADGKTSRCFDFKQVEIKFSGKIYPWNTSDIVNPPSSSPIEVTLSNDDHLKKYNKLHSLYNDCETANKEKNKEFPKRFNACTSKDTGNEKTNVKGTFNTFLQLSGWTQDDVAMIISFYKLGYEKEGEVSAVYNRLKTLSPIQVLHLFYLLTELQYDFFSTNNARIILSYFYRKIHGYGKEEKVDPNNMLGEKGKFVSYESDSTDENVKQMHMRNMRRFLSHVSYPCYNILNNVNLVKSFVLSMNNYCPNNVLQQIVGKLVSLEKSNEPEFNYWLDLALNLILKKNVKNEEYWYFYDLVTLMSYWKFVENKKSKMTDINSLSILMSSDKNGNCIFFPFKEGIYEITKKTMKKKYKLAQVIDEQKNKNGEIELKTFTTYLLDDSNKVINATKYTVNSLGEIKMKSSDIEAVPVFTFDLYELTKYTAMRFVPIQTIKFSNSMKLNPESDDDSWWSWLCKGLSVLLAAVFCILIIAIYVSLIVALAVSVVGLGILLIILSDSGSSSGNKLC